MRVLTRKTTKSSLRSTAKSTPKCKTRSTNRTTPKSTNQSTAKSTNLSTAKSTNRSTAKSANLSTAKSTNRSTAKSTIRSSAKFKLYDTCSAALNTPYIDNDIQCPYSLFTDLNLCSPIKTKGIKKKKKKPFRKKYGVKNETATSVLCDAKDETLDELNIEDDVEVFRDASILPSSKNTDKYLKFLSKFGQARDRKGQGLQGFHSPLPSKCAAVGFKTNIPEFSDLESDIYEEEDAAEKTVINTEPRINYNCSVTTDSPPIPVSLKYPLNRPFLNSTTVPNDVNKTLEFTQDLSAIKSTTEPRINYNCSVTTDSPPIPVSLKYPFLNSTTVPNDVNKTLEFTQDLSAIKSTTEPRINYNCSVTTDSPPIPVSLKYPFLNSTTVPNDVNKTLEFTQDLSAIKSTTGSARQSSEETTPSRPTCAKKIKLQRKVSSKVNSNNRNPASSTRLFTTFTSTIHNTLPDLSSIHQTAARGDNNKDIEIDNGQDITVQPASPLSLIRLLAENALLNKQSTFRQYTDTPPCADFDVSSLTEPIYDSDELVAARRDTRHMNSDDFYQSFEVEKVDVPESTLVDPDPIINDDDPTLVDHEATLVDPDPTLVDHGVGKEEQNDHQTVSETKENTQMKGNTEKEINDQIPLTSQFRRTEESNSTKHKPTKRSARREKSSCKRTSLPNVPECSITALRNMFPPPLRTLIQQKTIPNGKIFKRQMESAPEDVLTRTVPPPKGVCKDKKSLYYYKLIN